MTNDINIDILLRSCNFINSIHLSSFSKWPKVRFYTAGQTYICPQHSWTFCSEDGRNWPLFFTPTRTTCTPFRSPWCRELFPCTWGWLLFSWKAVRERTWLIFIGYGWLNPFPIWSAPQHQPPLLISCTCTKVAYRCCLLTTLSPSSWWSIFSTHFETTRISFPALSFSASGLFLIRNGPSLK